MRGAAATLALSVLLPACAVGAGTANASQVDLPTADDVGRAVASKYSCPGEDSPPDVLCNPELPIGASFRQILCVEYGSDAQRRVIVRCVYKGARLKMHSSRHTFTRAIGDGAIDVTNMGGTWLPTRN